MSAPAAETRGTLEEPQVRAMFDRIARVYDLMNTVMTAGMHHRWRERAVDLAQVGPGDHALELAREKAPDVTFEWGNALELPYESDSFDAVTVGFGARNFSDLARGLSEMARVARPGGRLVVLEITTPQRPPLSWFFRIWFDRVVPLLGRLAGDPDAYSYLPSSVRR